MSGKPEMIICEKCGKQVIKRSVNHKLCMDCTYNFHQEKVQELYGLDMRNEEVLASMRDNNKD